MEPTSDPIPQPRLGMLDRPGPLRRKMTNPSPPSQWSAVPQLAGSKRAAPGPLLPPFEPDPEPFSSSQGSSTSNKRRAMEDPENTRKPMMKYPTPVMTSETGIMSSPFKALPRPKLARGTSMISQRSAMAPIPEIILEETGRPVTMGRSSASSDYQLTSNVTNNRNISRVHVTAAFVPALSTEESNRVEITCVGCNGATVSCMAERRDLRRGAKFVTTNPAATILIDVFQARVMIKWPPSLRSPYGSAIAEMSSWDSDASSPPMPSPDRRQQRSSSPLKRVQHVQSPVSPTPRRKPEDSPIAGLGLGSPVKVVEPAIEIYEDETAGDGEDARPDEETKDAARQLYSVEELQNRSTDSGSNSLSEIDDLSSEAEEENDPVIHSFGPAGENLTSRLQAVVAGSPVVANNTRARDPVGKPSTRLAQQTEKLGRVKDHVIGQLAFSRLSSIPLSTIFEELPLTMRNMSTVAEDQTVTIHELEEILRKIECVGEIAREGKDACGKPLESEYYYVPDQDVDRRRADAVQGLGRGLRACRKTHKQYFWRRPKTP